MVGNRKARRLVMVALIQRNILRTLNQHGRVPYTCAGYQFIADGLELEFNPAPYVIPCKITFEVLKNDE